MKLDKRSKRTRTWLLEALLDLIEEKDYSEISITELTDKSGIARQTFYRTYNSMDDILFSKMDEIMDEYATVIQKHQEKQPDPTWDFEVKQLIYLWRENKAIFKALQKAGLSLQILEKLSEFFFQFHRNTQNLPDLDEYHQYLVYNLTGGIYNVLNKWFENDMDTSVEVIIDLFKKSARQIDQIAKEYEASRQINDQIIY